MALARLSSTLKRALYTPSFRLHPRYIVSTTPRPDENGDADLGLVEGQQDDDPSSSLIVTEEAKPPPVKARPYSEELREIMAAQYLSNQPLAKPHSLCSKASQSLTLQALRKQYAQRVSSVRKQYQSEMAKRKAAKATHDKKQREELQLAKAARLRLKKENSAKRALEVEEEKRVLQEQLAKETAERRAYRKLRDMKVDERRQRERDAIRQKSGTWVDEKDMELRIVQALANPIAL